MVKITFLHVATILYASLNEKCKLQYATKQEVGMFIPCDSWGKCRQKVNV